MDEARKAGIRMIMEAIEKPFDTGRMMEKLAPAIEEGREMNYQRSGVKEWEEEKLIAYLTKNDGEDGDERDVPFKRFGHRRTHKNGARFWGGLQWERDQNL